jgi:hypothetical protein
MVNLVPSNKTGIKYFYLNYLIIYALLSVFIATHFSKFITGNDAFLYLSIASKYASGHFYEAVNDYWSPLFSWLLTPLLFLKIDPIVAIRSVQFFIEGFTLAAFLKIIFNFKLVVWVEFFASVAAILLITYFSVEETPDVLFAGIVLWYVYFINKDDFLLGTQNVLLIGLLGALIYFTKAIGFYIFPVHVTFCFLYWIIKEKDNKTEIVKKYLATILVFIIISGIWITALSFKYHHFTISNAGAYNFAIVGPKNISLQGIKEPIKHTVNNGIYQLPDKFSLNYWERPQVSTVDMQWNPFVSKRNFNFFLHLAEENLLRLYYDIVFRLVFVLWLLSVLLYIFIGKKKPLTDFNELSLIGLTAILIVPYICIFIVPRYLLPAELLLLIATVCNFNVVNNTSSGAKIVVVIIMCIATINLGRYWLINFKQYNKSERDFHWVYNDIDKLHSFKATGTITSLQSGYDAMLKTSLLSYYTKNAYVGQISEDSLRQGKDYYLSKNKSKYLFVWGTDTNNDTLFKSLNTVFLDTTSHLKIFDTTEHR